MIVIPPFPLEYFYNDDDEVNCKPKGIYTIGVFIFIESADSGKVV